MGRKSSMPDYRSSTSCGSVIYNLGLPQSQGIDPSIRKKGIFLRTFYVLSATTLVIFIPLSNLLHSPMFSTPFFRRPQLFISPSINFTAIKHKSMGFLVFSNSCQIPDINPFDETIVHLVKYLQPLDCSRDYPLGTYHSGETLVVDEDIIRKANGLTGEDEIDCCYRSVRRIHGKSDNDVKISDDCTSFKSGEVIREEFIKVECKSGRRIVYKNFHAFVNEKRQVEERCREVDAKTNISPKYSVLIIGIDAVSRLNFHRQFRRTYQLLKQQLQATEMYGYNKIGENTFPNIMATTTGYHENELTKACWPSYKDPVDNCPFIWKRFAQNGYRTLYAEDTPEMSSFNFVKEGFLNQPTDYYFRPLILPYEQELGRRKDLYCHLCVGPTSETEVVLSWTKQFVERFYDRPFFALSWINSMTHDFLNYGSKIDDLYYGYIQNLHSRELLNSTILIIMSDHGLRWGEIQKSYIGKLEDRLPILLFAFPDSFRNTFPEHLEVLKENAHRLTTPYDLHATLNSLLNFNGTLSDLDTTGVPESLVNNYTSRAISLFRKVPKDRSCFDAGISEHWCTCQQAKPLSVNDEQVVNVSRFLLSQLNAIFKESPQCEILSLSEITDARFRTPLNHLKADVKFSIFHYTVTIRTSPGDALFEGTIRFVPSESTFTMLGDISRLNVYGDQSRCVDNAVLRKYCYCKL